MMNNFSTRILFILAFALVAFTLLAAFVINHSSKAHEREVTQRIHSELAQHVVDNYLLYKDGKPDHQEAKRTFQDLMILGANFEFYLLDKHGKIVSYDASPSKLEKTQLNLAPIKRFISQNEQVNEAKSSASGYQVILGDDPKNANKQKVFSAAPIFQMGEVYGYLYTVIGSQAQDELTNAVWHKQLKQSGVGLLLIILIFVFVLMSLLVIYISKPLSLLTSQVQKVQTIGFDKSSQDKNKTLLNELSQWPADSRNDIQLLGHAFFEALTKLQQQYNNVVSIDDLRKELLSHVSHDLRTPLASLLGYLETWELQFDDLSKEKSKEYIATAKNSAQKIASLIEQLFELAHLDGENVTVRKEPIPIAELVQDVLQKFAIQAHNQGVVLDVQPRDSRIVVRADIEKLERVFTNLLENALRHTPAGGSIVVKIETESGFVSIQVSDTGIGIPEQDLPHIFDPHYKAGNSVRENTAHGGLGLAITKKLLELHEANIRVASQLNQGTTFSFSLQSV